MPHPIDTRTPQQKIKQFKKDSENLRLEIVTLRSNIEGRNYVGDGAVLLSEDNDWIAILSLLDSFVDQH